MSEQQSLLCCAYVHVRTTDSAEVLHGYDFQEKIQYARQRYAHMRESSVRKQNA